MREEDRKNIPVIFQDNTRGTQAVINAGETPVVFEHRNNIAGQAHILSAKSLVLNNKDRGLFIERGFGMHATSMVAGVFSTVGQLLAEAEKKYGAPTEQNRFYHLGENADSNTQKKYREFQKFQDELKTLLELEREIDPNDQAAAGKFKSELLLLVQEFRSDMFLTPGLSVTGKDSDDILFEAEKLIKDFSWPLDADDETKTRRRKITDGDQLFLSGLDEEGEKDKETYLLDFNLACPGGMNVSQRDNFALCVSLREQLSAAEHEKFIEAVKENISPTKGLGLRHAPRIAFLEAKSDDFFLLPLKAFGRGIYRSVYALADLTAGSVVATGDAGIKGYRAVTGSRPDEEIDLRFDPEIDQKAKQDAVNFLLLESFNKIEEGDEKIEEGDEGWNVVSDSDATSKLTFNLKKDHPLTLFHAMINATDDQYNTLKKGDYTKKLYPFHTVEEVEKLRELKNAHAAYEKAYQDAYFKALQKSVETRPAALIEAAKKAAEESVGVTTAQKSIKDIMQQLQPKVLTPESEKGPDFIRASVFGSTYEIASAISGVIEDMGLRDPVIGTVALAAMGVGMAYVAMVGVLGHGSAALAGKASKFVHMMNETGIYPAFYHGIAPIHAGASKMDIGLLSFANGLVVGKATYIAMSLARSLGKDQQGFATEILNAVARNPIETAFVAAMLYGMGAAAIAKLHEQSALGSWKVFDDMVAAMKPAAVLYDLGIAMVDALHHEQTKKLQGSDFNPEQVNSKLTEVFFRALSGNQNLSSANEEILRKAIGETITDPTLNKKDRTKFLESFNEKVLEKIPEEYRETFNFLAPEEYRETFNFSADAVPASIEAVAPIVDGVPLSSLNDLSKLLDNKLSGDAVVDENHYMQCFAKAQLMLRAKPDLNVATVVNAVVDENPSPIKIHTDLLGMLTKEGGFKEPGTGFLKSTSSGDIAFDVLGKLYSGGGKKDQCALLFIEDLLESKEGKSTPEKANLWRLCNDEKYKSTVEAMTGCSLLSLQTAQPKQDRRTIKGKAGDAGTTVLRGAKAVGIGASNSIVGTLVKSAWGLTVGLFIAAPIRKLWIVFGNPSHESIRKLEKRFGYDQLMGVVEGVSSLGRWMLRVPANAVKTVMMAVGSRVASTFGFNSLAKSIDRRIADIEGRMRDEADRTKKNTIKRPDDVPYYRMSIAKVELVTPPASSENPKVVKSFLEGLSKKLSALSKFYDSGFVNNLKIAVKNAEDEPTALSILSNLFPWESQEIGRLCDAKDIAEAQKDAYKLASLRHLFCGEMSAMRHNSSFKDEFNIFTCNFSDLISALSGRSNLLSEGVEKSPVDKIASVFKGLRLAREKQPSVTPSRLSNLPNGSADNEDPAVKGEKSEVANSGKSPTSLGSPAKVEILFTLPSSQFFSSQSKPGFLGGATDDNSHLPVSTKTDIELVIAEYATDVLRNRFTALLNRQSNASINWIAYLKGEVSNMPEKEPRGRLQQIMKTHDLLDENNKVARDKIKSKMEGKGVAVKNQTEENIVPSLGTNRH